MSSDDVADYLFDISGELAEMARAYGWPQLASAFTNARTLADNARVGAAAQPLENAAAGDAA